MENESGSTRSLSVENSLSQRLWICCKTGYEINYLIWAWTGVFYFLQPLTSVIYRLIHYQDWQPFYGNSHSFAVLSVTRLSSVLRTLIFYLARTRLVYICYNTRDLFSKQIRTCAGITIHYRYFHFHYTTYCLWRRREVHTVGDDDDELGLYRWKCVFSHMPLSKRNILSVSYLTAFLKSVKLQQSVTAGNVVDSRNQLWPSKYKAKWSYTVICLCPVTAVFYNGKHVSFPGIKRPEHSINKSPHLAPKLKMGRDIPLPPLCLHRHAMG